MSGGEQKAVKKAQLARSRAVLFLSQPSDPGPRTSALGSRPTFLTPRPFSGFTLIELVITVAIVAILASAAVPLAQLAVQRGKEQELHSALRQIREGIDAYKQAADEGRIEKKSDASGYPPDLAVLVKGVEDIKKPDKPRIYFLRRQPRDPFATDHVKAEDTWGLRAYASPPDDPREGADVFDVYSLAEGKGLNGVPYKEW